MDPTPSKELMVPAVVLLASQTTTESALNAPRVPSGALPPADASSCAARTQSTRHPPTPASAFQGSAWSPANANSALATTSSATDTA